MVPVIYTGGLTFAKLQPTGEDEQQMPGSYTVKPCWESIAGERLTQLVKNEKEVVWQKELVKLLNTALVKERMEKAAILTTLDAKDRLVATLRAESVKWRGKYDGLFASMTQAINLPILMNLMNRGR